MADLIYEVHNHLARITLNRPEAAQLFQRGDDPSLGQKRWKMSVTTMMYMHFCFPETEKRSAQAVTSRQWQPVTDSSKVMKISPPQPSQERIHSGSGNPKNSASLEEIDKPVVAKIHGAAVGAGLDMALMCDVRIAGENASMSESLF